MSRIKPWSELESSYVSFDVNSTTTESKADTSNPSRIHLTTDGRIVMNGTTLGDRNPQRGHWDGRVIINKAVPCNAKAGMAYYFSDGIIKFKFKTGDIDRIKAVNHNLPDEFEDGKSFKADNAWTMIDNYIDQDRGTLEDSITNGTENAPYACIVVAGETNCEYYNQSPVIVVILKDGPINTPGKYKVLELSQFVDGTHGQWNMQTRSPYHIIHNGAIIYTEPYYHNMCYGTGSTKNLNPGNIKRLQFYKLKKKKKRLASDASGGHYDDKKNAYRYRLSKVRPRNEYGSDAFRVSTLYPILRDRKGRKSQGYAPGVVCRYYCPKKNKPLVIEQRRIYQTPKLTNLLQ